MEKINQYKNNIYKIEQIFVNVEFENVEQLIVTIKQNLKFEEKKWDFFHPFFSSMIALKICQFTMNYYDKDNMIFISMLTIKNQKMSVIDFDTIIYNYIDEACGLFASIIESSPVLTTMLEYNNKYTTNNSLEFIQEIKGDINFLCLLSLSERTHSKNKFIITFKLYLVYSTLKKIEIKLFIEGNIKFQKPKINLPVSKF